MTTFFSQKNSCLPQPYRFAILKILKKLSINFCL